MATKGSSRVRPALLTDGRVRLKRPKRHELSDAPPNRSREGETAIVATLGAIRLAAGIVGPWHASTVAAESSPDELTSDQPGDAQPSQLRRQSVGKLFCKKHPRFSFMTGPN